MGVRGLTTLLEKKGAEIAEETVFKKDDTDETKVTQVVVDGNALMCDLYIAANRVPCHNYKQLYDEVRAWIAHFKALDIKPTIYFDGVRSDNIKRKTILARGRENVSRTKRVVNDVLKRSTAVGGYIQNMIGLLLRRVAIDACVDEEIDHFVVDGEADPYVAQFSRENNCFLIGNDSDYYVMDHKGYIPLRSIVFSEDDETISCKVYKSEKIAAFFGITVPILPVWASILGNDYTEGTELSTKTTQKCIQALPPSVLVRDRFVAVAHALKGPETTEDALNLCARRLNTPAKEKLLRESVASYTNIDSALPTATNTNFDVSTLPEEYLSLYRKGCFNSAMNVLLNKQQIITPQLEDTRQSCSWGIWKSIRTRMYAVLSPKDVPEDNKIVEYMRTNDTYKGVPVSTNTPSNAKWTAMQLKDIVAMDTETRQKTMIDMLFEGYNLENVNVDSIPKEQRLLAAMLLCFSQARVYVADYVIGGIAAYILRDEQPEELVKWEELRRERVVMQKFHWASTWQSLVETTYQVNAVFLNAFPMGNAVDWFDAGAFYTSLKIVEEGTLGDVETDLYKSIVGLCDEPFKSCQAKLKADLAAKTKRTRRRKPKVAGPNSKNTNRTPKKNTSGRFVDRNNRFAAF